MVDRLEQKRIVFVSTMKGDQWDNSEELWSYTALNLVAQGVPVSASAGERSRPHSRVLGLIERGVEVWFRPEPYPMWKNYHSRRPRFLFTAEPRYFRFFLLSRYLWCWRWRPGEPMRNWRYSFSRRKPRTSAGVGWLLASVCRAVLFFRGYLRTT